ncbi:hypothetical protein OAG47_02330 [Verrucomicrobiales bacterium]|nr:hypothetical protein [Verrucomicrobiales bacterium]
MATKFGYVERDANTRVNWGDIGKSFSDMLITTREKGEAEFKALDNLATVAADVEVPLGANTTWNQIFMDNANDIKAFSVSNNKAWKNGDITTYEYQRRLQNLTDNSDLLIKTQQNLNKQYANLVKSSTDGTMSDYTRQNMDNLMRFTNLNNTRIVIQKDGTMVGNKVISDGKGGFVNSTDPNDTVSLQAFGNIFLQDVKEFDSNAALDKVVNKLGDYEYVFKELATYTKAGTLFKVKDITAMDSDAFVSKEVKEAGNAFLEAEEAALSEIMADPFQAVSVLMDGVGGFTNCKPGEDCKGSKNIKQEYTEGGLLMPSLTEEQIDMGKDFLRSQFRAKLDRTVAATSTGRPTRPSYRGGGGGGGGDDEINPTEVLNMIKYLWSGTKAQIKQADEYFRDFYGDVKNPTVKVGRTDKGVYVDIKNSATGQIERTPVTFEGKNLLSFIKAVSPLLVGGVDLKSAIKNAGYTGEEELTITKEDIFAEKTAAPTLKKDISRYVSSVSEKNNMQQDLIASGTTFANTLKDAYADTGIEFEYDGDADGGIISIVGSDLSVTIKGNLYRNQKERSRNYIKSINDMIQKYMRSNEAAYRDIVKGEGSVAEEEITEEAELD